MQEKLLNISEKNMINFDEEIKKFKPSLDVDDAEGAIYSRDLTDVIDILKEMMEEANANDAGGRKGKN